MDLLIYSMYALILILVLSLAYMMIQVLNKHIIKTNFFWFYRGVPYFMKKVDLTESQYYNKRVISSQYKYVYMADYPTVDDVVIKKIANQLNDMCAGRSESYKAGFLLAFVQQNFKYVHDLSQYDFEEYWAIPIETLESRKGDCEDTSLLYSALAYNMGLKVVTRRVIGHVFPAVPNGMFTKVKVADEYFYPAETTGVLAIPGLYSGKTTVTNFGYPQVPCKAFKDLLVDKSV